MRIDYDDILSIIADSSSLALDDVVDAAAAGDQEAALAALGKARATGIPASSVIGAAIRHVATLHKLSLRIERGERAGSVVDDPQLRIHFRRKPLFERALARFGPAALGAIARGSRTCVTRCAQIRVARGADR